MLVDERLTRLCLLQVHGVGFSYLWNKGLLQLYPMVERSPRGKFSSLWFIKDCGVFSILWGKFLLYSFGSLGQGS